ncbi:uncharacterized protein PV09_07531 [Verruconis gallopava]|uniref:Raptor N-terminal CASPase-like domain-containing protein n=1 Tax=Verruconis gallopava TaxID=253628 RepID=A0A0D2APH1_9PEZI|nr:uncharacterized protein PV09_07531 [Verruconis gallopava]KIW01014.1 hypothetical protein PV09_07531 [Verruconis gallopava]
MADILTLRSRSPAPRLNGSRHQNQRHMQNSHGSEDDGEGESEEDAGDLPPNAHNNERPHTAPRRLAGPNGSAALNRTSTGFPERESRNVSRNTSPTPGAATTAGNGGRPALVRAKSDFGPRREESQSKILGLSDESESGREGEWGLRHGFETQLESEEYNRLLESNYFMYFTDKKHDTGGNPKDPKQVYALDDWRMRDRLKTVSAVLALCLNIGVDPPDVIKTSPCAKLECWVDPSNAGGVTSNAPINNIGKALQSQYEQLSMRTRYKLSLDPTVDETRRYTSTLRRNARNERVLFHYNGHGVPKPTSSGEIWVFNRTYTQYIPISLYDLQSWIGAPSLFVWDCSDAGLIIQNFLKCVKKHKAEDEETLRQQPNAEITDYSDCVHLAACRDKENLPTNPALPADVFTSCLTTPIEMAVRFFILQNPLPSNIGVEAAREIPGRVSERRTPLGELNWIFTAITDTIAWSTLDKKLFKRLFRQDLMGSTVAALFRNFLLAQRVMRVYHCHPVSEPSFPSTHDHPLWQSWDLAVESILSQLPDLQAAERGEKTYEYQHSNFFAEQLTAFEVYLSQGGVDQRPPEQLPVVLQVLLSQVHRLRALILLSKFLDLGPWAVQAALSIGIFPYVLKLLQSQAMELKPVMVFIWARILACDQTCQQDLLKDNGYQYFTTIMNPNSGVPVGNVSEHRAMCAFIIAMFCKDFPQGQVVCNTHELIDSCIAHLHNLENPLLRQWSCLCISRLWADYPDGKWTGIRTQAWQKLCELVVDPVAEVRTAMLCALTTFLGVPDITPTVREIEENIASVVLIMASDGNSMVRKELLVFYSVFVNRYMNRFIVAAYEQLVEEHGQLSKAKSEAETAVGNVRSTAMSINEDDGVSSNTVYAAVWKQILIMSVDPFPEVSRDASIIVDCVFTALTDSPLGEQAQTLMNSIAAQHAGLAPSLRSSFVDLANTPNPSQPTTPPTPTKQESYLTASLKRTASVAASLKNFAFGTSGGSNDSSPNVKSPVSAKVVPNLDGRGPLARQRTGDWNLPPDVKDHHASAVYPTLPQPEPSYFKARKLKEEVPTLPLKSGFFDWCAEYFREPQMKPSEADEPGSEDYNQRLWRRNRNDRLIHKTQPLKEIAGTNPWDKAKGFFNNGTQPQKMVFHQFEDHLVVSDDRDGISVWDWKKQTRLNRFSNGNPGRSRITEIRLINEDDQALLMTGSSDGVIKIFKNYEQARSVEMVTAFRALTDLEPSTKNAGLVFDWQQSRGLILVAGDVRSIRVWNAGTEICTTDINARSGSPITSLTSDQVEGHLFVAGFGDGALRLYDQRQKPQTAMVQVWKEHKSWITNVHLQRGGQRELVSACRNGEVKFWDMRWDKSFRTVRATKDTLRTLSVHEHAPVFAVGTDRHVVKIFSMMGLGSTSSELEAQELKQAPMTPPPTQVYHISNHRPGSTLAAVAAARAQASSHGVPGKNGLLNTFEPYSGFLNPGRGSPINCTAFHPHRMMIAGAAYGDTHINIYACSKGRDKWLDEGEEKR